ncbi:MAG TPA: hypothetical protein VFM99_00715, partial [Chitinophagales bacterium]|nr:hypothetical protein [Chitinophagales bacterium]
MSRTFYFNGKSANTELEKTDVTTNVIRKDNKDTKISFYQSGKITIYTLLEKSYREHVSEDGSIYYTYT